MSADRPVEASFAGATTESRRTLARRVMREEVQLFHPRVRLAELLLSPLPPHVGSRLRTLVLRRLGMPIGHGTVFWDVPRCTGDRRVLTNIRIGALCRINIKCMCEAGAPISIADRVGIGRKVMVITTTHAFGGHKRRSLERIRKPVRISSGVWVGARATILPGVTVHDGAVIAAGAVVAQDVPPNVVVGGVPARVVKQFDF